MNSDFIFLYPGYNFRSTEINAIYGINQLIRLNYNNKKRINNFRYFLKNLDENKFLTNFSTKGSCNYAFIVIFDTNYRNLNYRKKFENTLKKHKIEFRRGTSGGGNQTIQPYLQYFKHKLIKKFDLTNVKIIHDFGYYLGNYPELDRKKILEICKIINSIN